MGSQQPLRMRNLFDLSSAELARRPPRRQVMQSAALLLFVHSAAAFVALPTPQPALRHEAPRMLTAPEVIDAAVSFDTFAPQFLWLLIVAAPEREITRRVMGPIGPIIGLSLVHFAVVLLAASAPGGTEPIAIFADVFDPAKNQLDGMVRLFEVRDFVAEEWPHGKQRVGAS